jgi:hypothetical protein
MTLCSLFVVTPTLGGEGETVMHAGVNFNLAVLRVDVQGLFDHLRYPLNTTYPIHDDCKDRVEVPELLTSYGMQTTWLTLPNWQGNAVRSTRFSARQGERDGA